MPLAISPSAPVARSRFRLSSSTARSSNRGSRSPLQRRSFRRGSTEFGSATGRQSIPPSRDNAARDIGLKAVTAARLSAAFPYVSPAATLDVQIDAVEPYHLVDGGYYDVYGLVALSQWVDDALEELSRNKHDLPPKIGVVIARGLASSDSALRDDDAPAHPIDRAIAHRGWRWQLTAPPAAALHAQTFAQWAGGMQTLRLLIGKWASRGVNIIPCLFDYPGKGDMPPVCQGSPLSWKLTAPQQHCIEAAWKTFTPDPLPASLR